MYTPSGGSMPAGARAGGSAASAKQQLQRGSSDLLDLFSGGGDREQLEGVDDGKAACVLIRDF